MQGVRKASELAGRTDAFRRDELIYFLRYVCVPEVLDQTLVLDSTRAVEDERTKILVLASEVVAQSGKTPPLEFVEELEAIKTRQVVRDTTLRVDQSRIYVNTEGIRRSVGQELRESWQRYLGLSVQETLSAELNEIQRALEARLGEKITVLSLSGVLSERSKLITRMILVLRDMFSVSKEYGLDANLSTNIRHGFVMREIRGPLLANHLVTNKASESGEYQPNMYWVNKLYEGGSLRRN